MNSAQAGRLGAFAALLLAGLLLPAGASAARRADLHRPGQARCPETQPLACARWAPAATTRTARSLTTARALPRGATAAATDTCPPEAAGAVCGHVDVPLDRTNPGAGTIAIAFELYAHTGPGPAVSAILVNPGGPGASTTAAREAPLSVLGGLLERHDLLLVDNRGTGRSAAIDCPSLQHGTAPVRQASQACAGQLGTAAQRYGSGDIAQDNEAVRAALGYDKVDFIGVSYGGVDVSAYGTRFGHHLRSVVLDSPFGTPYSELFFRDAQRVQASVALVGLICARSPSCSADQRDPVRRVAQLVARVRDDPVTGTGLDADGRRHALTVTPETVLLNVLGNQGGPFVVAGEIAAAADALRHGDRAPLLRLAAEGDLPVPSDAGDPAVYSMGALGAIFCPDNRFPWSATAPLGTRVRQWEAAVRDAADGPFAPFRASEVLRSQLDERDLCLPWPGPTTASPIVEAGATYPRVPTLVLGGDLDGAVSLDASQRVAALFPDSRFVPVTGAGHVTFGYSDCAVSLAVAFIETLQLGDTGCADRPPIAWAAVGRFPRTAFESPPATADPAGAGSASTRDLRVARAAVDTLLDALKRSILGGGDGPGLRGGSFHTEHGPVSTTTLERARYAKDVAVGGTARWAEDGTLDANLAVDGPGRRDGLLHVVGSFIGPGEPRPLAVTGALRGRRVAASVPSA